MKKGVCPELKGAYTGAISTSMLKSIGVQWALAGHSERRVIYGETDDYINAQCLKLIEQGMSVMLCIGESEAEFEQDLAGSVCAVQLKKGLKGISAEDMSRVAIAYEPVWAIGTGKGESFPTLTTLILELEFNLLNLNQNFVIYFWAKCDSCYTRNCAKGPCRV